MSVTFGKRVVGEEAHAAAVKKAAGGAEVFGKRVLGSIPEPNTELIAKRNSEFGPRTTGGAQESNAQGENTTVSVEELENILTENPTFLDSLYENELALPTGPRKAALQLFALFEQGIKGAGRKHVLDEIAALLGTTHQSNQLKGAHVEAQQEQIRQAEERNEENKLLKEAPRVKALREREDNLNAVRESKNRGTASQLVGTDVDHQVTEIEGEHDDLPEQTEEEKQRALPDGVAAPAQGEELGSDHEGSGEVEAGTQTRTKKPLTKKQKAARRKAAKARRAAAKKK